MAVRNDSWAERAHCLDSRKNADTHVVKNPVGPAGVDAVEEIWYLREMVALQSL